MGKLSVLLAAILCATAPVASVENVEPKTEQYVLGKEVVSTVREAYRQGKYSEFLSRMDAAYKTADLEGLIQMRQKEIPLDFQEKWEQQFSELQKHKNHDLLSALSDRDGSPLAEKVRSAAANLSTPEQEKAISRLNALIALAPHTGMSDEENQLIDIDLEYEYKLLHAQLPYDDISPQERQELQIALRMEKMDKMLKASKNFKDHALKQAVELAAANHDARLARNLDGADLNSLVKSKAKPTNELEEKVFSIISSYQGQFSDLMKDIDHANR